MKKWYYLLFAVILLSFNACKDEEESIEATKLKLIERLDKLDVPAKMKTTQHPQAKEASGYVDEVKGIATYFDFIQVPEDAEYTSNKSTLGGDTYYWNYGGYEMWETITTTSSKNLWQVDINDGSGRTKYIVAEEMKDGSSGFMQVFDYTSDSEDWFYSYDWSFDSSDNATLTWRFADDAIKYEIKSNADLSGSAKYYIGGELLYSYIWNKDGSGSLSTYILGTEETITWSASDL